MFFLIEDRLTTKQDLQELESRLTRRIGWMLFFMLLILAGLIYYLN